VILLEAHKLASEKGVLHFANLLEKGREYSTFSSSGFNFKTDLNEDWEIDMLRTGCLGHVTINLPRIAYESGRDKAKFYDIFKERFEMTVHALEIKDRALRLYAKGLLPFLMQSINGDHYFRLENGSRLINLAGLKEAIEALYGKSINDCENAFDLIDGITQSVQVFLRKMGRRRGKRLSTAIVPDSEASERLAQLDVEKYGIAKVRFSGTRENPFYSTVSKLVFQDGKIPPASLLFERKKLGLSAGGNLTVVEFGESEQRPDELVSLTKQIFESYHVEFLSYARKLTYCINCKRSWFGLLHKCPSCGSTGTLTIFDQFEST